MAIYGNLLNEFLSQIGLKYFIRIRILNFNKLFQRWDELNEFGIHRNAKVVQYTLRFCCCSHSCLFFHKKTCNFVAYVFVCLFPFFFCFS